MKLIQDVYIRLQQRLLHECASIDSVRDELRRLAAQHNRYVDLDRQLEIHRERMFNILRLLGPKRISETIASDETGIIRETTAASAKDLLKPLPIWKCAREYLRIAGDAQVGDVQTFLASMGYDKVTRQSLESAFKRHDKTFSVKTVGHQRTVTLKK